MKELNHDTKLIKQIETIILIIETIIRVKVYNEQTIYLYLKYHHLHNKLLFEISRVDLQILLQ
jgi:hypothetical protein